ncbi:MAG TPA: O-antigen ligase family protein, partial [Opitutus sp.]|nr:O-antigen ligase family protein [Opitutus sp.]
MRLSPPAALNRLAHALLAAALAGLAILTLIDRGATRAYSTPWIWLFWFIQFAPLAIVALRAFSPSQPLQLPSRSWCALAGCLAAVEILSALLSPYRGPSVLATLTPLATLATFLLLVDWLAADRAARTDRAIRLAGFASLAIVVVSLGQWLLLDLPGSGVLHHFSRLFVYRNAHPLGHSNYTAALAVFALPWFGALVARSRGRARAGWLLALLLGLALLFSSGSRGGLLGLAALVAASLALARVNRTRLALWTLVAGAAAVALAYAHPRTRTLFSFRRPAAAAITESTVQRAAMLTAGLRMGDDRPLLGWGPGTTPLVYPRFRAGLDGGVEDILQLHCTPTQIYADLGVPGLLAVLCFILLVARATFPFAGAACRPASIALAGFLVFSLTDYCLDVPIFAFALAACAALVAPAQCHVLRDTPGFSTGEKCHVIRDTLPGRAPRWVGIAALAALVLVAGFGRRDPAPALNVRALQLARDPAQADRAIALLRQSLALNDDQEIAHFNLGWLLVTRDPPGAEAHFLAAAHLVPDKGGVYFGLALSRLNQKRDDDAARALALA